MHRRHFLARSAGALSAPLMWAGREPALAHAGPLLTASVTNILCLGDSITRGLIPYPPAPGGAVVDTLGGWRGRELNKLWAAIGDREIRMVGRTDQPESSVYGGFELGAGNGGTIVAAIADLDAIFAANTPQIVQVLLGVNDGLAGGWSTASATTALENMVTLATGIQTRAPGAAILIGTVPAMTVTTAAGEWAYSFNSRLPHRLNEARAAGLHARLIDVAGSIPPAYLGDGIHPVEPGYQWIAERWYAALTEPQPALIGT